MAVQPTGYSLVIKINCTFTCIFLLAAELSLQPTALFPGRGRSHSRRTARRGPARPEAWSVKYPRAGRFPNCPETQRAFLTKPAPRDARVRADAGAQRGGLGPGGRGPAAFQGPGLKQVSQGGSPPSSLQGRGRHLLPARLDPTTTELSQSAAPSWGPNPRLSPTVEAQVPRRQRAGQPAGQGPVHARPLTPLLPHPVPGGVQTAGLAGHPCLNPK